MIASLRPLLVVDDDRSILTLLGIAVQRVGYQPTLATTAVAALQALTVTHFVAVLLDYGVSAETDHTLITQAYHTRSTPALILMTGHSWEHLADQRAPGPICSFLFNPFGIRTFYAILEESLHRVGAQDSRTPSQERYLCSYTALGVVFPILETLLAAASDHRASPLLRGVTLGACGTPLLDRCSRAAPF
jgi:DNA-binding NtrC family response regulator